MKKPFYTLLLLALALVIFLIVPGTTVPTFAAAKAVAADSLHTFYTWAVASYRARTAPFVAAFQSTVNATLGFGVIGELAFEGPLRAQPAVINHGTPADIMIGRWFTLDAAGTAQPGGTGAIGGVLSSPKEYSTSGIAGNALAPTLLLPTGTVAEFVYMGAIIVAAPAAVAIGAAAKYNTTTGVIGVGAPGGGEAAIPNSKFIRYPNAAAGLAVLELTN